MAFADHQVCCDASALAGTAGYMAPELVAAWSSEEKVQYNPAAADWWSVGAVIYEAATGRALLHIDAFDSQHFSSTQGLNMDGVHGLHTQLQVGTVFVSI